MESEKLLSIIAIIIGLIFIIFPMFSANLISILIGASVFIFGVIMVVCASETAKAVTILIGVGLLFIGITDFFAIIWVPKNAKRFGKMREEPEDIEALMELDDTNE